MTHAPLLGLLMGWQTVMFELKTPLPVAQEYAGLEDMCHSTTDVEQKMGWVGPDGVRHVVDHNTVALVTQAMPIGFLHHARDLAFRRTDVDHFWHLVDPEILLDCLVETWAAYTGRLGL